MRRLNKILIANRGEIVRRIQRTLRKLEIASVVIYDEREKNSVYVLEADQACSLGKGPLSETFLNGFRILELARKTGCDAIHPGYGFLSENAEFAKLCESEGLVFIGPSSTAISLMGNKAEATKQAAANGLPVVPQFMGGHDEIIASVPADFYPCLVKASAGGGGKGMQRVNFADQLPEMLEKSAREAQNYFGSSEVYVEKYLENPRHIEVQILGDEHGNVIHLFERECTIQRRYQKIIEEAPSPTLTDEQRRTICKDAVHLASSVNYRGAGTVEFLLDTHGRHYFLEMNTRIQVEHGVTEEITGIDIVAEQIAIAAGEKLSERIDEVKINGHAIEARLYAEDPEKGFMPSPGLIRNIYFPELLGVRVDESLSSMQRIYSEFDPMMAKIIGTGKSRNEAAENLKLAIKQTVVQGIKSNSGFLINVLNSQEFNQNRLSTHYVEKHFPALCKWENPSVDEQELLVVSAAYLSLYTYKTQPESGVIGRNDFWRLQPLIVMKLNDLEFPVDLISFDREFFQVRYQNKEYTLSHLELEPGSLSFCLADKTHKLFYSWNEKKALLFLNSDFRTYEFTRKDFLSEDAISSTQEDDQNIQSIHAPLNGRVIKLLSKVNGEIPRGDTILVIESMKMENEVKMPRNACVSRFLVREGQMVSEGDLLADLK